MHIKNIPVISLSCSLGPARSFRFKLKNTNINFFYNYKKKAVKNVEINNTGLNLNSLR